MSTSQKEYSKKSKNIGFLVPTWMSVCRLPIYEHVILGEKMVYYLCVIGGPIVSVSASG